MAYTMIMYTKLLTCNRQNIHRFVYNSMILTQYTFIQDMAFSRITADTRPLDCVRA